MKKIVLGIIVFGMFLACFSFHQLFAQEKISLSAHNAVILFMNGEVKIKKALIGEWKTADVGIALFPGDNVKTGESSWVEIGVGVKQSNVMRVKENTLVEITNFGPMLHYGELRALVEDLSDDDIFEIRTPTSVCGIRGTGWDIITDGIKAIVDVFENNVYFSALSKSGGSAAGKTVKSGKRGVLEDPKKPIKIKDIPLDKIKNWNKWKKDLRKRMALKIKNKVKGTNQQQNTVEGMMKGKSDILERRDDKNIGNRLSIPTPTSTSTIP